MRIYLSIDFTHVNFCYTWVFCNFTKYPTISTPNDKNFLWLSVCEKGDVCNHFLISMFIALSDLNDAIQNQNVAVGL